MDGVVIANEIIDKAKKNKDEECFIFKVDFEKAYDSGLAGIMRSAVAKRLFRGYEVGKDKVLITHLQYADDTLLIGANSTNNIMVLKSILKCFELASGLRINFHKSQFIGINSDEDFVQMAVHKMFCCVGSVPFKFLGIPVGANPKRIATWWRLLFESHARWVRVIRSRYVARMGGSGGFSNPKCFKRGSSWWRDLGCLGNRLFGVHNGWFTESVRRRTGDGESIVFWRDLWVGEVCLFNRFHRLFQIALDKDACISFLGEWRDGSWLWSLIWRRRLYDWEKCDEEDLLNCLKDVKPVTDAEDGWLWIHAKDGAYSVQNSIWFSLMR
ncbi:PREDICTED: uncharacterized protein LOC109347073 [Lupinus angustifolius]|uniref:uncharacterized protein LOC109347073 n=1 Tax=Lupinus angustifolius TaxID=3871 RepID=UPI00092E2E8A|nr:PREDICTED: uncharacterized protein LOC109347073 [Lupinus angustifolius]